MFGYYNSNFSNIMIPQQKEDFYTFFNKNYMKEIKDFLENPKFSMKYFMVMAQIRQNVFEKSKIEYIEKYKLPKDYFTHNKVDLYKTNTNQNKN